MIVQEIEERSRRKAMFLLSALALLHGCTDGPGDTGEDTSAIEYTGCRARPQRADRNRTVVVSIPYDDQGGQSEDWRSRQRG